MTSKSIPRKPITPASAAKTGFAGGVLFTFSILFFVMLSLMISGYTLSREDGYIERTLGTIQDSAQAITGEVETETPVVPVVLGSDDHVRGSSDAPVTIVEYSDFECPYCQSFHPTMQQVMQDYAGEVKWVYRHYPLSFHPTAQMQAEASECVAELGGEDMFWSYADLLFAQTETATKDSLAALAVDQGINEQSFVDCLSSGRHTEKIASQVSEGTNVGVNGTPGNIVIARDGSQEMIAGAIPYSALATILDEALNK